MGLAVATDIVDEPTGIAVVADQVSGIVRIDLTHQTQSLLASGGALKSPIAVAVMP